jgi:4-hydroxy-2-oxoheptanedioate aldolase
MLTAMGKLSTRAVLGAAVRERRHLRGCFVKLGGLETIDAIALAGADFCVLDLEHSTISTARAFDQIAYARALGLPCLVRVPTAEPGPIGRWLDAGATGVQLADVASAEDALALVRACRYAPEGDRGMSPSQRDGGYGAAGIRELQAGSAGAPVLVAQVERELDPATLAAVAGSGIDVLFVGHADLAVRLGTEDSAEVAARVRAVTEAVASAAAEAGVMYGQHGEALPAVQNGGMYVTVTSDAVVLASGLRAAFGAHR